MKKITLLLLLLSVGLLVNAQEKKINPNYDEALAKKYGAEENGMKMYVLVILKTGTNTTATKVETDSAFAGHMANMGRLVKLNKLIVAGPLGKNDKTYRGIFILNTKSLDEAKEILATDPAVKAKLLDADIMNWYGSAALAEYLKAEDKIWKARN
ncbi:hypothetical protein GM921_07870 [Pedobacter sp. LMG 31464]|uniref:YCII-related domain-containing protein n=1 Tax=Pedobacter planticolens TaxID=2679964 RepID=A0A923IUY3_9SPHI|nr:YciI family protein [Pedobacter planticolens]MBB2145396.1 hypothetical protein [Pedobacter planticolens]